MDQDTRHWYLQQMGIPVWLPKSADSAVLTDDALINDGLAAPRTEKSPAISSQTAQPPVVVGAGELPVAKAANAEPTASPEAGGSSSARPASQPQVPTQAPAQVQAQASHGAPDLAAHSSAEPEIWLVMPDVPATQKPAAEDLLNKILNAVEVPATRCKMIWGLPDAMPAPAVKWVWCFGVQAPAGLQAQTLSLPSLADMLNNVDAKRQAWGLLKNSMPFG